MAIERVPNPHKGAGRRRSSHTTGLTSKRSRRPRNGPAMSYDDTMDMYVANGIEVSMDPGDANLGISAGYTDAQIDQRIKDGVYNNMGTPEEMLARVRVKLMSCGSHIDKAIAAEIIDILGIHGMGGLKEYHLAWIPKSKNYKQRRADLKVKITPGLKAIDAGMSDELKAGVDNDFEYLMEDGGGTGKTPTNRKGLYTKLMDWMHGPEEKVVEHVEIERVRSVRRD